MNEIELKVVEQINNIETLKLDDDLKELDSMPLGTWSQQFLSDPAVKRYSQNPYNWTLAFFNPNTPRSVRPEARNRSLSLCTETQRAVSKGFSPSLCS